MTLSRRGFLAGMAAARPNETAAVESALGAGFRWEEASGSLYLDEGD